METVVSLRDDTILQMQSLKILFMGPAGAGKGTQCARMADEYGLEHISTGDLIRTEIKSGSALGNKVKEIVESGNLVSDDIVNEIVKNKIQTTDKFLLDGYPRTLEQAKFLADITELDYIFNLSVPDRELIKRLSGRRMCTKTNDPNCKGNFHTEYKPPKVEGICDLCGSELYQRPDDNPDAIATRLSKYDFETGSPLSKFYQETGRLVEIDANKVPEQVFNDITSKLETKANAV
jgi:adenylate kinase